MSLDSAEQCRAAVAECQRLTAENGRLRDELVDARHQNAQAADFSRRYCAERDALRLDLARLTEHEASLERQLEDTLTWRNAAIDEARAATADLHRLTVDAAAECGRLRAERDGLLAAARDVVCGKIMVPGVTRQVNVEWLDALRAAVAACTPGVKP